MAEVKGTIDEEYLYGMRHLRRILEDIYKQESLVGATTAGGLVSTTVDRRRGGRRRASLPGGGEAEAEASDENEEGEPGLVDLIISGRSISPRGLKASQEVGKAKEEAA
jgi:hypothetical protein